MDVRKGEVNVKKLGGAEPVKTFTFDSVYDINSKQETIYNETAFPIVKNVLEGYNGTIFAYGQTGTGKTYTMDGMDDPATDRGVMTRTFETIFASIKCTGGKQYLVKASYLEIYKEELRDLLIKNSHAPLEIKEKPDSGVYVKDLQMPIVTEEKALGEIMLIGRKNRVTAETNMNARSSRSHSIFTIVVETADNDVDTNSHVRVGKLHLVDLAGSERISKTGAEGEQLKEAIKINMSLSTLCHVIATLVETKNPMHIPYRNSKLTRLLQDSLGGNTKTVMIANIGPADWNYEETLSTLRYANRAKSITNNPKINEDPKDALLREYSEQIQMLKAQLEACGPEAQRLTKTITTKKIISKEDGEKIKELELKLQKEKEEAQLKIQQEMKKIYEEKNIAEEDKKRILDSLKKKEEENAKQSEKQQKLLRRLKEVEEGVVVSNKIVEEAKVKELEVQKLISLNQEAVIKERKLQQELEKKKKISEQIEKKYNTASEEIEDKNRLINNYWSDIQKAKAELRDIDDEFIKERQDMMEQISELRKQIKLKSLIIDNFIPPNETTKISKRAKYNEEQEAWVLQPYKAQENNNKFKRPMSALNLKRPMIEYGRISKGIGEINPRFLYDNIANLELERYERMTDDYTGMPSNKITNAIKIALDKDDDMPYMPLKCSSLQYLIPSLGESEAFKGKVIKRPVTAAIRYSNY